MYKSLLKPVLFRLQPETAHHLMIAGLSAAGAVPGAAGLMHAMYGADDWPDTSTELWGIRFPNPVGLAAGLDKDGRAMKMFSAVGFGFVEVGTVTPRPQPGNEKPRLYRLPEDGALINRMGFNNRGADYLAERLKSFNNRPVPVMVNIGKNKVTPNEKAVDDYLSCLRTLYPHADLFAVNISSPNTPGLRDLQQGDALAELLSAIVQEMAALRQKYNRKLPILVKLAPDLSPGELERAVETICESGVDGIIATNTTLRREGLKSPHASETGGLSGKPLTALSTEMIRRIYGLTLGKLPIIGCGGIFTAEDAYEKIRAGASLVQLYTSLIYEGPAVNRRIVRGLSELLRRDGYSRLSDAVGADAATS
jgi:dihydroorotate dehydrogenase